VEAAASAHRPEERSESNTQIEGKWKIAQHKNQKGGRGGFSPPTIRNAEDGSGGFNTPIRR